MYPPVLYVWKCVGYCTGTVTCMHDYFGDYRYLNRGYDKDVTLT